MSTVCVDKTFHLPSNFKFPTRKYGSRDQFCQYPWFSEVKFLHHDMESEALFCHMCHRYRPIGMDRFCQKKGRQKQRANFLHNRSKFEQSTLN